MKTFDIDGHILTYSTGIENYNFVIQNVRILTDKMEKRFDDDFKNRFPGMDSVMKGVMDFCYEKYIEELVGWGAEIFAKNGIYEYDKTRFFDEYALRACSPLIETNDSIEEKYLSIVTEQQEAEEYRRQRKASRGRWEGGGFGVDGMIKGAMVAGTANMASGLAYSTANAIGNIGSAIKASNSKSALYNSSIPLYRSATKESMEAVGGKIIYILSTYSDLEIEAPDTELLESDYAILRNIQQGNIIGDEAVDKACEMLFSNPYIEGAYRVILDLRKADPNGNLDEMAQFFGFSLIKDYKDKALTDILSSINYYTEKGFETGVDRLDRFADDFYVDITEHVEAVKKVRALVDQNKKTADGNVYDTEKESAKIERYIKGFLKRIAGTSGNDLASIKALISDMESSDVKSKKKYIDYLQKEIEAEDSRFRNVKSISYPDRESAEQARKDAVLLDSWFKDKVFSSRTELEDTMDKVKAISTDNLRTLYTDYLNMCMSMCDEQEKVLRENAPLDFESRKDFALFFYTEYLQMKKAKLINMVIPEYETWYETLYQKYTTIGDKDYNTPQEADKAYYKTVDHARAYLQYVTEKNTEKRSLFSKIKTGVTGVVYKNYEPEYNILTENGIKPIPDDDTKADAVGISNMLQANDTLFANFQKEVEEKFDVMGKPSEIEQATLNADSLFVETLPVEAKQIHKILVKVCPNVDYSRISRNMPKQDKTDKPKNDKKQPEDKSHDNPANTVGTSFTLRLENVPEDNEVEVSVILGTEGGLPVEKAVDFVTSTPCNVEFEKPLSYEDLTNIKNELEKQGVTVSIVEKS